ncbi:MAG: hypothetical protein AAB638_03610, partial [Patescibacteria group bacterium]
MFKKILIIIVGLSVGLYTLADTVTPSTNDFSYLFHLYYDNGQLYADRDFQFKYDIIAAPYVDSVPATQYPYRGEIINILGEVAKHFVFDPRQGDLKFTKGKVSVRAPYVADGEKAVFLDAENQPILTVFVSDSSFCDDNGICDADRGEDSLNCPKDCKQSLPAPPVVTPSNSASSGGIVSSIAYVVIGVALIGFVLWFLKRRKGSTSM